jgi:plasmid stability protein
MATLVIKNLPDHLHVKLKLQAQRHRRSLTKEALTLLEQGIAQASEAPSPRQLSKPIRLKGGPLTIDDIESAIASGRD